MKFHEKKHATYDLRMQNLCKLPEIKTQGYGQESLSVRGRFFWNNLVLDNTIENLPAFTASMGGSRTWLRRNAPAKYAANYSFLLYTVYFLVNSLC